MYTLKDKTYAEPGCFLKSEKAIGLDIPSEFGEFEEERLPEPTLEDGTVRIGRFLFRPNLSSYGEVKKYFIQRRYSNDDQIAIILNRDEDDEESMLAYQKMQEFRDWASIVARKIMEVLAKEIDHGTYSEL